ncbi:glutamate dehydrogenase, partial [Burkholderia multivorans]
MAPRTTDRCPRWSLLLLLVLIIHDLGVDDIVVSARSGIGAALVGGSAGSTGAGFLLCVDRLTDLLLLLGERVERLLHRVVVFALESFLDGVDVGLD